MGELSLAAVKLVGELGCKRQGSALLHAVLRAFDPKAAHVSEASAFGSDSERPPRGAGGQWNAPSTSHAGGWRARCSQSPGRRRPARGRQRGRPRPPRCRREQDGRRPGDWSTRPQPRRARSRARSMGRPLRGRSLRIRNECRCLRKNMCRLGSKRRTGEVALDPWPACKPSSPRASRRPATVPIGRTPGHACSRVDHHGPHARGVAAVMEPDVVSLDL